MGWFSGNYLETISWAPGAYEAITVTDAAIGLTAEKIKPSTGAYAGLEARGALLTLETADIRFRLDGTAPTAGEGHYLVAGDSILVLGTQSLKQFQAIRTGVDSGVLRVTYFF